MLFFAYVVNSGRKTLAIEQVVTQLQQEMIPLKARVADQTGLAEAVRAINNLATAQVRKDTSSLIDVKGLGRPKEFTGKEEDFQLWSKKTEAFFARVIKGSEMMLEWSTEQVTEITQEHTDLEFTPTATNVERGVLNLEFVLQKMYSAQVAFSSFEAFDIVANSRKKQLEAWRRLQKRYDPTTGGRKRNLLRTIDFVGRCSLWERSSWTKLSSGTLSWYRTMVILRVGQQEEAEGQVGRRDQACWSGGIGA